MKKPSNNRNCTVCPKNKKPTTPEDDESPRQQPNNKSTKNQRFRLPKRTTTTQLKQRKRASSQLAAVQKRTNIRKIMNQRRANNHQPSAPVDRPLAIRSTNHYFGIDYHTDVPRPQLGDTFCNTLTGQLYLYNKDIWNLIPSSSPRAYYGPSTNQINQVVVNPQEGDLFLADTTDEISIYQNGHWNTRKIIPNQPSSKNVHSLVTEDTNIDSSQAFDFEMEQLQAKLTAKYQNVSQKFSQHTPSIDDDVVQFPVLPNGSIKLALKFSEPNQTAVEFGLEAWIRYSDTNQNIWQTVTCLTNLEVLDEQGRPTQEYILTSEKHQPELINLDTKAPLTETLTRTLTTLAAKDNLVLTSKIPISQINFQLKLLAYPIKAEKKDFYAVEFNDLNQAISLPKMLIKKPTTSTVAA